MGALTKLASCSAFGSTTDSSIPSLPMPRASSAALIFFLQQLSLHLCLCLCFRYCSQLRFLLRLGACFVSCSHKCFSCSLFCSNSHFICASAFASGTALSFDLALASFRAAINASPAAFTVASAYILNLASFPNIDLGSPSEANLASPAALDFVLVSADIRQASSFFVFHSASMANVSYFFSLCLCVGFNCCHFFHAWPCLELGSGSNQCLLCGLCPCFDF